MPTFKLDHLNISVKHLEETIQFYEKFFNLEVFKRGNIPLLYGGIVQYPHSQSIYVADPNGLEIKISDHFGGGLS